MMETKAGKAPLGKVETTPPESERRAADVRALHDSIALDFFSRLKPVPMARCIEELNFDMVSVIRTDPPPFNRS